MVVQAPSGSLLCHSYGGPSCPVSWTCPGPRWHQSSWHPIKIPDSKMEEEMNKRGKRHAPSVCAVFPQTTLEHFHLFLFWPEPYQIISPSHRNARYLMSSHVAMCPAKNQEFEEKKGNKYGVGKQQLSVTNYEKVLLKLIRVSFKCSNCAHWSMNCLQVF